MTKLIKISAIIFVVSIILPILAYKIKSPTFLNTTEMEILRLQEPAKIDIIEKREFQEFSLDDPFKLGEKVKMSTQEDLAKKQLGIFYISLIYHGKERYVILGENIAKEGDRIGDVKVVKILNDRVLLKNKKGEKIWLKLESY